MRGILFFTIIFVTSHTFFAQNLKGLIIDSETKKPIPYVNIGIINQNKGTVSNYQGEFEFKFSNELMKDSISISSIGYKTKHISTSEFFNELSLKSIIELYPKVIALEEITLIAKKSNRLKIIGNKIDKEKGLQFGFHNSLLGHEIAIKIKTNQKIQIKRFNTFITKNTKNMLFRLNFYDVKDGKPNKKIVNKNIIFSFSDQTGMFTFDLNKYHIFMENDFYLSVEIIESYKNNQLSFSSNLKRRETCLIRKSSQDKWQPFGNISVGFYLIVQ